MRSLRPCSPRRVSAAAFPLFFQTNAPPPASSRLLPPQDILANLFKLQIGGQKHWNVYTHSFLQFGLNSARARMLTKVTNAAAAAGDDG